MSLKFPKEPDVAGLGPTLWELLNWMTSKVPIMSNILIFLCEDFKLFSPNFLQQYCNTDLFTFLYTNNRINISLHWTLIARLQHFLRFF